VCDEKASASRSAKQRFHQITPKRVLHSNFGCCIGTIQKSETYKISGAAERRAVPIRELVENKPLQLKRKNNADWFTGSLGIFLVLSRKNRRELVFDI
jgi:hypothetical protein